MDEQMDEITTLTNIIEQLQQLEYDEKLDGLVDDLKYLRETMWLNRAPWKHR